MGVAPRFLAPLVALLASACAQLTAEHPLFSPADQGPAPIMPGLWIAISEECPERFATEQMFPSECAPMEIRALADGAWRVEFRRDLVNERRDPEESPDIPMLMTLAPVAAHTPPGSYARAYIAELRPADNAEDGIGYAVLAPLGELPTDKFVAVVSIDCNVILRDGPIEGIDFTLRTAVQEDPDGAEPAREKQAAASPSQERSIDSCTAHTQAAVREAARRAVIEEIESLTRHRFVRIGSVRR